MWASAGKPRSQFKLIFNQSTLSEPHPSFERRCNPLQDVIRCAYGNILASFSAELMTGKILLCADIKCTYTVIRTLLNRRSGKLEE
jgi:hypothetical protein